jgi:hypothetical protein
MSDWTITSSLISVNGLNAVLGEGIVWAWRSRAMKLGDVLCSICREPMTPKLSEKNEVPVCYLCKLRKTRQAGKPASKPTGPSV